MKTNLTNSNTSKFKATFLRLTAIFVSIVLLSFTVSAQEFWKTVLTHNSINDIAAVLVEKPAAKTSAVIIPANSNSSTEVTITLPVYEVVEEEVLEIEDWMLDNGFFNRFGVEEIIETEQPLKLEPWMQNEKHFSTDTEFEKRLQLQPWMTDENFWG